MTGRPAERPGIDDQAAVDLLCDRLVQGLSMREACSIPECPTDTAVYRGMARNPEFAAAIARAREAQQHAEAEKCIELADQATAEDWQVVKLRIWARQWRAAKLAPKVYGEKIELEQNVKIATVSAEPLTEAQWAAQHGPKDG